MTFSRRIHRHHIVSTMRGSPGTYAYHCRYIGRYLNQGMLRVWIWSWSALGLEAWFWSCLAPAWALQPRYPQSWSPAVRACSWLPETWTKLLLVSLGFFSWHIHCSEVCRLYVLDTESEFPWLPKLFVDISREWFADLFQDYWFYTRTDAPWSPSVTNVLLRGHGKLDSAFVRKNVACWSNL